MTDIIDVTATTLRKLRPPRTDEDPTAWRWFMAGGIVGTAGALAIHIALACGFLGGVWPGFARADDTNKIKDEVQVARVENLEARIFDLRVAQCAAIREGKSAQAFTIQLQSLLQKYVNITQRSPNLPICEELK